MKLSKMIAQIFKRCKNGDNYKESRHYFRLIAIAFFLILFFFSPPIYYLDLSLNTYINFGMLMIVLVGIVFFVGIFYDESRKAHSIKIINILIGKMKRGDWDLKNNELLNHVLRLHPVAISNEITMYILGHFFLHEGYTEEGDLLIHKAKNKNPNLEKINLANTLNATDANYLYDSFKSEKALQSVNYYRQFWEIKAARYTILFFFFLFIFLHLIVQIFNM